MIRPPEGFPRCNHGGGGNARKITPQEKSHYQDILPNNLLFCYQNFNDKLLSDISMNNVKYNYYFAMKSVIWGIE